MPKAVNLLGQIFGRLTVLERIQVKGQKVRWKCKCDCGNSHQVITRSLLAGHCKSCGCYSIEVHTRHGDNKTKFYKVWIGMLARCYNPNTHSYKHYGGRGITVCDEWRSNYPNFKRDMFEGYQKGLSIDRIDNNKGYYKENCRWATMKIQSRNQRRNRIVETPQGPMVIKDAARICNITYQALANRINTKVPAELLFSPSRLKKRTI